MTRDGGRGHHEHVAGVVVHIGNESSCWLANSVGQPLLEHSVLVGRLAGHLVETRYRHPAPPAAPSPLVDRCATLARVAGYLHDIGKLEPRLRDYLHGLAIAGQGGADDEDDDPEALLAVDDGGAGPRARPRHEEIGWLLLATRFSGPRLREHVLWPERPGAPRHASARATLEYVVFWHHARPVRSADEAARFTTANRLESACRPWLDDGAQDDLRAFLTDIDRLTGSALSAALLDVTELEPAPETRTPAFKSGYALAEHVTRAGLDAVVGAEAERTLVRSAVVTADRIVSALSVDALLAHVHGDTLPTVDDAHAAAAALRERIGATTAAFERDYPSDRTAAQHRAAVELGHVSGSGGTGCLRGPAGCGKTVVALAWLDQLDRARDGTARRVVVLVPRTAVGINLFEEITTRYGVTEDVEYLSGVIRLYRRADDEAAIETPPELEGTGALLITTIDQLCRAMLSHQRIDWMTRLADADVIVDEVHELLELPGIALLFLETLRLRRWSRAATLLVSATPSPASLALLGVEPHDVVTVVTFNHRPYRLVVHRLPRHAYEHGRATDEHPFLSGELDASPGDFVVCNTATLAQRAALAHAEAGYEVLCLHSRYTPRHRLELLRQALDAYGERATEPGPLLVAGPVVQASLDISTAHLHLEACHAENLLQRIGRCNRFGRLPEATIELYVCRLGTDGRLATGSVLHHIGQRARTEAFAEYLFARLDPDDTGEARIETRLTLDALYAEYDAYHRTEEARVAHEWDLDVLLKRSRELFERHAFDPVRRHGGPRTGRRAAGPRLSAASLRGASYYVLPLLLDIEPDGGDTTLSLLWTDCSPDADRLTDDLHATEHSSALQDRYVTLSRTARHGDLVASGCVGEADVAFLQRLGRRTRSIRRWPTLKACARDPDTPMLVAGPDDHEGHLYYVRHRGTWLGLMRPSDHDGVARRPLRAHVERAVPAGQGGADVDDVPGRRPVVRRAARAAGGGIR